MAHGALQKIAGFLATDGTWEEEGLRDGRVAAAVATLQREHGPVTLEPRPDVLEFGPHDLKTVPDAVRRAYIERRCVPVVTGRANVRSLTGLVHKVYTMDIPPEGLVFTNLMDALVHLRANPIMLQEQDPAAPAFPNGWSMAGDEIVEAAQVEEKPAPKAKPEKKKPAATKAKATTKKPRREVAKADESADKE